MGKITRIWDLDEPQQAALTEEEILRYIDIEVAHEGIAPVACPQKPSLAADGIVRSEIAFKVAGVIVRTAEDAQTIQKLSILTEEYDYKVGYEYKWLIPIVGPKVEQVSYYKQDDVSRVCSSLQNNESRRSTYQQAKDAWDKYIEKTGKVRGGVWSAVNEARQAAAQIALARETYHKYLDLAKGDVEVAAGFFRNTYKNEPKIIEAVIGALPAQAEAVPA
jgi:hypothetical protein